MSLKTSNVSIESADLSANIPVKSQSDFRFSFWVVAGLEDDATKKVADELTAQLQPMRCEPSYGGHNIFCSVSEEKNPGMALHLTRMFQEAGVRVSVMGGANFQEHPLMAQATSPAEIPTVLQSVDVIVETADKIVARYKAPKR